MCFALVAMPSDYDCWREIPKDAAAQDLLEEIIGNLNSCSANFIKLIEEVSKLDDEAAISKCECNKSLERAIWTAPQEFTPEAIEILEILKR
jgi:5'-methylthioadenosine phosphorylase